MQAAPSSFVSRFESHLDKFLPVGGKKCELFSCVPGWIWLIGAGFSVITAANMGWATLLKTVLWQALMGWGVAWLCRGCHTRWLWFLIILGVLLPILIMGGMLFAVSRTL